MSTYVVSDLHGQLQPFETGLKTINFSKDDQLYVIGDVIDRGFESMKILQKIKEAPNMSMTIGNHELMMINSVDPKGTIECSGKNAGLWLEGNGGDTTYEEYRELPKQERIQLLQWLNTRPIITEITVNNKSFVLCHTFYSPKYAGIPVKDIPYDTAWLLVWESLLRDDSMHINIYRDYPDKTFITGHVPVFYTHEMTVTQLKTPPSPYIQDNLIDIDGGLSWGHTGVTNAAIFLRLDDMKHFAIPLDHTGFEDLAII